jgi:hypothetical protein
MTFRYCDVWGQRVAEEVCQARRSRGECRESKGGCKKIKKQNLSDEERARRSEAMKKIRRQKEEVT